VERKWNNEIQMAKRLSKNLGLEFRK